MARAEKPKEGVLRTIQIPIIVDEETDTGLRVALDQCQEIMQHMTVMLPGMLDKGQIPSGDKLPPHIYAYSKKIPRVFFIVIHKFCHLQQPASESYC